MKSATAMLLGKTDHDVWLRGEAYSNTGRVDVHQSDDSQIRATVQGTADYEVSLRFAPNGISRNCNCAYFNKAGFICKHIVAVAIWWDKARGIPVPDSIRVEVSTPRRSTVKKRDLDKLFDDPLNADLELVSRFPELTSFDGRGRPHSLLPETPRAADGLGIPLVRSTVKKCCTEIKSWSSRKAYDQYFCGGEMIAAFCRVLRSIAESLDKTPSGTAAQILIDVQAFHRQLVTELIDDSSGLRAVSEAHLEQIYNLLGKVDAGESATITEKLLKEYESNQGEY